jgi:hypothetical protein
MDREDCCQQAIRRRIRQQVSPAKKDSSESDSLAESRSGGEEGAKFRAIDGELQSDVTFDHEIVDRIGPELYELMFQPAIREALPRSIGEWT